MNNYILTSDIQGLLKLPQMAIQELMDNGKIKVNGKLFTKDDLFFREDEVERYAQSLKKSEDL